MVQSNKRALEAAIESAGGSSEALRAVFTDLVDRVGAGAASELWWAVFGAQDAAET